MNRTTRSKIGLILLAYIAFISLGLPDGLLGVAWPSMRASFSIPLDSLGMLLFAGMTGYLTSSFMSGRMIARIGVGGVLAGSCALTGAGLIGYTLVPTWWMMVALGVVAGLGAGAIDSGLNTYVAANFGEGLMQWLHACYGIGVTLGPIIMTVGINVFNTWRVGYLLVGTAQLALAGVFTLTLSRWQVKSTPADPAAVKKLTDYKTSYTETLRQPAVWLSILLFFLYTGAEASLGSWAYTLLTESRGIAPQAAGLWAGSYWATFTIGRILAGIFTRRIAAKTLVSGSLLLGLVGALMLWWNPGEGVSLLGVVVIGFAIAPVFPGLVSGTSARVGKHFAANTIGMQMGAASIGVAVIPGLLGAVAQRTSLEVIPVFMVGLFVVLFALYRLSLRHNYTGEKT